MSLLDDFDVQMLEEASAEQRLSVRSSTRKKPGMRIPNNYEVAEFRTGYTALINISHFREQLTRFRDALPPEFHTPPLAVQQEVGVDTEDADISVSDLRVPTPFEHIEEAIEANLRDIHVNEPEPAPNSLPLLQEEEPYIVRRRRRANRGKKRKGREQLSKNHVLSSYTAPMPLFESLDESFAAIRDDRKPACSRAPRPPHNVVTPELIQFDAQRAMRTHDFEAISTDELLLRVCFLHPTRFHKEQEFWCATSNPLSRLRDRVHCLEDQTPGAGEFPSGYFFMEDVFYDDTREPNAIRYSDSVVEWAKQKDRVKHDRVGAFQQRTMEDTTWGQLSVRLGSHYVYCHHGDCYHPFVITDLRALTDDDLRNRWAYPMKFFQERFRSQKCLCCTVHEACFTTVNDKLTPSNPYFWCEACYFGFHYDSEGQLLYDDFEVYPYFHD